ncbi:MAG TPA: hypothetical protein VEA18_01860 [Candidatus Kapabacteria bacterium]|nr:hypothetical protein [Candidatus Kapabacteria bacterium]
MTQSLSPTTLALVANYLHLPFPGRNISCPYFNNRRAKVRGALRVLIGKGSVRDITEEAMVLSLKEKIALDTLTDEQLKQFLVDHHIGIDCSALVYYALEEETRARGKGTLSSHVYFPATNIFRKFLTRWRPVENTSVSVLSHDKNSTIIPLSSVQPGDMIILLNTGRDHTMNHVLLIHEVEYREDGQPQVIHYTHSLQWRADGKYNHGVRQGTITITDANQPLLQAMWEEHGRKGNENETFEHALLAETLTLRRLNVLV